MSSVTKFILGQTLLVEETRYVEFKEISGKRPASSIANTADEYAVAFLNSDGGRVYWGIRDADKAVVGVRIPVGERDLLRREVMAKLSGINPQIDPSKFRLHLHPIEKADPELVVVELEVPAGNSSRPFSTSSHECFVRLDGVKQKLNTQQLADWILGRAEKRTRATNESGTNEDLLALAQRVRRIFSAHGLQPGHLARFLAIRKAPFTITFSDQETDRSFLRWLEEPKIEWIAKTFGVRREWINGEGTRIFEEQCYDKRPAKFLADISRHADASIYDEVKDSCEAWFLRMGLDGEWETKGDHRVVVIVRVPLARMSNEVTVYRYVSDFEPYGWDDGRTAIQLRAWARLLFVTKGMTCFGRHVSYDLGQRIWGNGVFLHEILESPELAHRCRDEWHPEDYALYPEESCQSKPGAEFPHVIAFLRENRLPHQPTTIS